MPNPITPLDHEDKKSYSVINHKVQMMKLDETRRHLRDLEEAHIALEKEFRDFMAKASVARSTRKQES